jgi:hypothetical protein
MLAGAIWYWIGNPGLAQMLGQNATEWGNGKLWLTGPDTAQAERAQFETGTKPNNNPTNRFPSSADLSSDEVIIPVAATPGLQLSGPDLKAAMANAPFDIAKLTVNGSPASPLNLESSDLQVGGTFTVGNPVTSHDVPNLALTSSGGNGSIRASKVVIAAPTTAGAMLSVDNTVKLNVDKDLKIGETISGAAYGTGKLTLDGAVADVEGATQIGFHQDGTLIEKNGAELTAKSIVLGQQGGIGVLVVKDDSDLIADDLRVGGVDGTGVLNVNEGDMQLGSLELGGLASRRSTVILQFIGLAGTLRFSGLTVNGKITADAGGGGDITSSAYFIHSEGASLAMSGSATSNVSLVNTTWTIVGENNFEFGGAGNATVSLDGDSKIIGADTVVEGAHGMLTGEGSVGADTYTISNNGAVIQPRAVAPRSTLPFATLEINSELDGNASWTLDTRIGQNGQFDSHGHDAADLLSVKSLGAAGLKNMQIKLSSTLTPDANGVFPYNPGDKFKILTINAGTIFDEQARPTSAPQLATGLHWETEVSADGKSLFVVVVPDAVPVAAIRYEGSFGGGYDVIAYSTAPSEAYRDPQYLIPDTSEIANVAFYGTNNSVINSLQDTTFIGFGTPQTIPSGDTVWVPSQSSGGFAYCLAVATDVYGQKSSAALVGGEQGAPYPTLNLNPSIASLTVTPTQSPSNPLERMVELRASGVTGANGGPAASVTFYIALDNGYPLAELGTLTASNSGSDWVIDASTYDLGQGEEYIAVASGADGQPSMFQQATLPDAPSVVYGSTLPAADRA